MGMYYEQDMNFKEIGAVLGVSESRVCQLHSQAIARLRGRLRDWSANPNKGSWMPKLFVNEP
jgi:RNA polymerase sigma factor for flagellar operon FliA